MSPWQQFLFGTIGLIGISFGHEVVVKIIRAKPVEEIIYEEEAPKKRIVRKIASLDLAPQKSQSQKTFQQFEQNNYSGNSYSQAADPETPADPITEVTESNASPPDFSDGYAPLVNQGGRRQYAGNSPSSKNFDSKSVSSTRSGGALGAMPYPVNAPTIPTSNSTSTGSSGSGSSDSGDSPQPTYSAFTDIFTFTDDDAPNYVIDPSKVQIAGDNLSLITSDQSFIDSLLTDFNGQHIGLEYGSLSDGSNGLTNGTNESCNSLLSNCAEFDLSWIPQSAELMGLWHFNDTAAGLAPGGRDFVDSSGNNRHGTKIGSPQFDVLGRMQGSLRNRSTIQGGANLPVDMSGTNKLSVSFWFNNQSPDSNPGETALVMEYTVNFNVMSGFYFAANDCSNPNFTCNNMVFAGHHAGGFDLREGSPLDTGWQHIVLIYDRTVTPNVMKVYKNGEIKTITQVLAFSSSSSGNFSSDGFYLFGRQGVMEPAIGDIDELAIWKTSLTDEEIKTIYDRQSAGFGRGSSLGIYVSEIKNALIPFQWDEFSWVSTFPFGKQELDSDLTNGLIAHWKFDEPVGTTGNNSLIEAVSLHNGTPGTGVSVGEEGKHKSGAYFDGTTNAFINVANPGTLNIRTNDWSVGAWIKSTKMASQFVISKSLYGPGTGRWALGTSLQTAGKLFFMYDVGAGGVELECTTGPTVTDGKWHHVMTTLDRDGFLKMYVDAVECKSHSIAAYSAMDWNTPYITLIGNYNDNTGMGVITSPNAAFEGLIDELSIWNRVVTDGTSSTAEEIQKLYKQGISRIRHQVRFCDDDACVGESWLGPDGTTDTFYSETPSVTFASPQTTQFVQYRSILETESTVPAYRPELNSVAIPMTGYESDGVGTVTGGIPYQTITSFDETIGSGGCSGGIHYQISNSPIGPWYYWNNIAWTLVASNSETNTVTELNDPSAINLLRAQFGTGILYVNILLGSNGITVCNLESFEIQGER